MSFPTVANTISNLSQALQNEVKVKPTEDKSGQAFIKFDYKRGEFFYGRDAVEITQDEIIVNTDTLAHGWILWHQGKAEKELVSVFAPLPEAMESKDEDHPSEARGFMAAFPDDADTKLVFESNSYGGRKGVDALLNSIRAKSMEGETEYLYPVVKLTSESYKHPKGLVHNPIFEVVGWVNRDLQRQGEAVKQVESKPEAEPEVEAAAPVRRRRRKAAAE